MSSAGWSVKSIKLADVALATSTRRAYDLALLKCRIFANQNQTEFPPVRSCDLAEYICYLAEGSVRPQSVINTFLAAIKQLYRASGLTDISEAYEIKRLVTAVTKAQTDRPMIRSAVLPVDIILSTIKTWGLSDSMPLKFLRIKAITLLALALMLRPSDIAPHATFFDNETYEEKKVIFSIDMLKFQDNGVEVTLFGTKNDLDRKGFVVFLPAHTDETIDPVETLKCYIRRTECLRKSSSVFLSLKAPYGPLSSAAVAKDLQRCIDLCGLKGYSAKSFRSTGATVAIETGEDPKIVQSIGRWKSTEVFYTHYVHNKTNAGFTSNVLS